MSDRRLPFARARKTLVPVALLVVGLAASAGALAARVAPPATARDLAQIYFSNTLTRAEIVSVVGRVVHDFRIDEGRVTAVRASGIDLLERDGTRQTIAVDPGTQFVGVRFVRGAFGLRGTRVVTLRDNDSPATLVRPSATARQLGKSLLGAALVRAEVVTYAARTLRDVRIDEGKVVSVRSGSFTLLERDGTRQAIATSPSTLVTGGGGTVVDAGAIAPGLMAIAVRAGDGPASQVYLAGGTLGSGP
jgi:hypothetical protein